MILAPSAPFTVTLEQVRERPGPNYQILEAVLSVRHGSGTPFTMTPQLHAFSQPQMTTNQAAIQTYWNGQLYLVLGEQSDGAHWLLRMWWKPFVTLIWLGGAMIALGGTLSLLGRVRRDSRRELPQDGAGDSGVTRKWLLWLPFALCVALFGAFFLGLRTPSDHVVIASQLVGKALPGFEAPAAFPDMPGARTADFADGKPRLLNVFASWCVCPVSRKSRS